MKTEACRTARQIVAAAATLFVLLFPRYSIAASVAGGTLTLDLNRDALIAGVLLDNYPDAPTESFPICCRPSIYLEEFFDAAAAASRTVSEILNDNTPDLNDLDNDEIPAVGLSFAVNGTTVSNAAGRANQPTTLTFDPADLFGTATGAVGFGGVLRWRVDVAPPTNRILTGDMTLEYRPALEGISPGHSGWTLVNHISFTADAFELYDVATQLNGSHLTISGNLGFGSGFDHLGAGAARQSHARIGTFELQTTVVPLPAALWLVASGITGLFVAGRAGRKVSP